MRENKINCIVIEDEPLAAEILKDYIAELPNFHLVAYCSDAIAALEILKDQEIDLIFLDINLPKLKGFDFLKTLTVRPKVIITSAYHEYALKSFEYNVVDYLLKPIEFTRFLNAVNKVTEKNKALPVQQQTVQLLPERKYLFFSVGKKSVKIFLDEIAYVESVREYVKIYYNNKFLLTKIKISDIEQVLIAENFIRIHRSYIVNINKIDSFSQHEIEINSTVLPVSRSYKEKLQLRLHTFK
ncbi:LytR/AlgR family response regulator transcription factor [Ferruginibacter sp.]|nr:response regulator transcription factor [Ferruginibacter sp.]